jgi:hypothetical protein
MDHRNRQPRVRNRGLRASWKRRCAGVSGKLRHQTMGTTRGQFLGGIVRLDCRGRKQASAPTRVEITIESLSIGISRFARDKRQEPTAEASMWRVGALAAHVRFGSKADICAAKTHVRFTPNSDRESGFPANGHVCFTPESGHVQRTRPCLLWANSGLMQCSKHHSIRRQARYCQTIPKSTYLDRHQLRCVSSEWLDRICKST